MALELHPHLGAPPARRLELRRRRVAAVVDLIHPGRGARAGGTSRTRLPAAVFTAEPSSESWMREALSGPSALRTRYTP